MAKIIRLTENDLSKIVRRVIKEQGYTDKTGYHNPGISSAISDIAYKNSSEYKKYEKAKRDLDWNKKQDEIKEKDRQARKIANQIKDSVLSEMSRKIKDRYLYEQLDYLLYTVFMATPDKRSRKWIEIVNQYPDLKKFIPSVEVLKLMGNLRQNARSILDGYKKSGVNDENLISKLTQGLQSGYYDNAIQDTSLPTTNVIKTLLSKIDA